MRIDHSGHGAEALRASNVQRESCRQQSSKDQQQLALERM
jgi:hypothetical protein